jgi:hypothetical protein
LKLAHQLERLGTKGAEGAGELQHEEELIRMKEGIAFYNILQMNTHNESKVYCREACRIVVKLEEFVEELHRKRWQS